MLTAFFLYLRSILVRDILTAVSSKNEPLAIAESGGHHLVGDAFPHLVSTCQVSSFNALVANENLLSLQRSPVTLVQRAGGVSVHALSKFQPSTFIRKDSEIVSLQGVGDQRVEQDPRCGASRAGQLHLTVGVAVVVARPAVAREPSSSALSRAGYLRLTLWVAWPLWWCVNAWPSAPRAARAASPPADATVGGEDRRVGRSMPRGARAARDSLDHLLAVVLCVCVCVCVGLRRT